MENQNQNQQPQTQTPAQPTEKKQENLPQVSPATSPVTFTKEEMDLLISENIKLRGELDSLRKNFDENRPGIGTYALTGLAMGVGIGVAGAATYHFLNRNSGSETITLENE